MSLCNGPQNVELLICGFIRDNYPYGFHIDLNTTLILFYDDTTFKWAISGNKLADFLAAQRMKLKSDTFYVQNIPFECYLIKGLTYIGFCWRVINLKKKTSFPIKIRYQMKCKETKTNWKFSRIVFDDDLSHDTKHVLRLLTADGYGWPYKYTLRVSDAQLCAKKYNSLTFCCTIVDCTDIMIDSKSEMNPMSPDGYALKDISIRGRQLRYWTQYS
eukprot:157518_1